MRIGFMIYGSLDTMTGGYLYDAYIVRGLKKRGHDVEVVSLPSTPYPQKVLLGFSPTLPRRLLDKNFDVLIQDELCHPTLWRVNQTLGQRGGPLLVALVHHIFSQEQRNFWYNKALSFIEHRFLSSVDGFIHNSVTTRNVVASLISHTKPEVVAYPAGNRLICELTEDDIIKRSKRPGPLELLFLGNVIPRKGLIALLETLQKLDEHLWRLTVVGGTDFDPAHTQKVRELIGRLGLESSVNFIGFLEDDELVEVLKASHLFCMPYAYEGFGMAMLEAMSFGLPPVSSSAGAAGETVLHGKNGFLVAPEDGQTVREIITELYHDRSKLVKHATAARSTFLGSPDWQDGAEKIDKFVRELASSARNHRQN